MNKVKKLCFCFGLLFLLYMFSMMLVYCIPDEWIEKNMNSSLAILEEEGEYPKPFFVFSHPFSMKYKSSQLDNFTDKVMLNHTKKGELKNPFVASVRDYSRYWHGYEVILRPILMIMDYNTIRQVYSFLFFLLFCSLFTMIKEQFGWGNALFFALSMLCGFAFLIPMCMHFFSVFAITFCASIFLLYEIKRERKIDEMVFFFVIGSLVNFVDLLSAPLFSLCFPLVLLLLNDIRKKDWNLKNQIFLIITCSIGWGLGYAFTWISKWAYSSLLLDQNIFAEAYEAIVFRTNGGEVAQRGFISDVIIAWGANVIRLCTPVVLFLLGIAMLVWLICFLLYRKPIKEYKRLVGLLIVAMFTFIWYAVLRNHSQAHGWFTYRVLLASIFAILCAMFASIDRERLLRRKKKRSELSQRTEDVKG